MSRGTKKLTRDWRDGIRPGDVLYEAGDPRRPRVVRAATFRDSGPNKGLLLAVDFSILRCSWTKRPYTTVCRVDLKARGFVKAGVRITSMTLMDKRLNACIADVNNRRLSCCDVRGMR